MFLRAVCRNPVASAFVIGLRDYGDNKYRYIPAQDCADFARPAHQYSEEQYSSNRQYHLAVARPVAINV